MVWPYQYRYCPHAVSHTHTHTHNKWNRHSINQFINQAINEWTKKIHDFNDYITFGFWVVKKFKPFEKNNYSHNKHSLSLKLMIFLGVFKDEQGTLKIYWHVLFLFFCWDWYATKPDQDSYLYQSIVKFNYRIITIENCRFFGFYYWYYRTEAYENLLKFWSFAKRSANRFLPALYFGKSIFNLTVHRNWCMQIQYIDENILGLI